jgi:hypothetical protein
VKVTEFHTGTAEPFKFEKIGDTVDGTIVGPPELIADTFNEGKKVLAFTLDTEDSERKVYARSQMLRAIGQAVVDAGADSIDEGGALRITYSTDRALNNGRSMKVYTADYVPPSPMGTADLGEVDDPWAVSK